MTNSDSSTQYYRASRDVTLEDGNFFQVVVNNSRKFLLTTNVLTDNQIRLNLERINQRVKVDTLSAGVNFIPTTSQIIPSTISIFSTNPNLINYFPISIIVNGEAVVSFGDPDVFDISQYLIADRRLEPFTPLFPSIQTYLYDVNKPQPSHRYILDNSTVGAIAEPTLSVACGSEVFVYSAQNTTVSSFSFDTGVEQIIDTNLIEIYDSIVSNDIMAVGLQPPSTLVDLKFKTASAMAFQNFPTLDLSFLIPDATQIFRIYSDYIVLSFNRVESLVNICKIVYVQKNCLLTADVTGGVIFKITNVYDFPTPTNNPIIDLVVSDTFTFALTSDDKIWRVDYVTNTAVCTLLRDATVKLSKSP